ncbi:VgrG-related protein [Kribbia dieselivorans]|uniref:VgrG-related protein n=1 Tax=Kribbia dieselivorans TaxID=331526 RepID=UPI000838894A|nr:VgrG-related protein [Kribbia dieselivorans]
MRSEETSSTPLITIGGRPLSAEVESRLSSVVVDDSVGVPDLAVISFLDDDADMLERAAVTIGAPLTVAVQQSGTGAAPTLFTGEVTALEVELTPTGTRTIVRGYDKTHRFRRGVRVEAFVNQTPADIIRAKAQAAGVPVGRVDPFGSVQAHTAQVGSDWELIQRLAFESGVSVAVKDGKLVVGAPTGAASGPGANSARRNPMVLERGVNLVSLRATVTAADQVPSVEVRSWDVKAKKAIVAKASAGTSSATLDGVAPAKLAQAVGAPAIVAPRTNQLDAGGCDRVAKSIADRVGGSHAELEGVARGNPDLRAGEAVTLVGVGKPFNGKYTLTSTRHEFSDRGYVTAFSVSNSSDRSAYGLTTSGGMRARADRLDGMVVGIVSDIKDPDGLGRVRVTFPALSDDFVSAWSRTLQLGAGANRGFSVLPEVGDEVLVAFGLGGADEPYILGGLFNGRDRPKQPFDQAVDKGNGKVVQRSLVSRTGMALNMIESESEQKIDISTSEGKQRITLVQKADAAIEIVSQGPVNVTAQKDVTVTTSGGNIALDSTQGNITLAATNITLDAKADVKINATNLKLAAKATGELTGATVKVAGQAMAELSAAAATTVKGAIVKIN